LKRRTKAASEAASEAAGGPAVAATLMEEVLAVADTVAAEEDTHLAEAMAATVAATRSHHMAATAAVAPVDTEGALEAVATASLATVAMTTVALVVPDGAQGREALLQEVATAEGQVVMAAETSPDLSEVATLTMPPQVAHLTSHHQEVALVRLQLQHPTSVAAAALATAIRCLLQGSLRMWPRTISRTSSPRTRCAPSRSCL